MNEQHLKRLVCVSGIFATLLVTLPLISGVSGHDTIMIRGFNLMEFSPFGCVPLLAPMLIVFVACGSQTQAVKESAIILFTVGNLICYTQAFNIAREWLSVHADSMFTCYPGIVWVPAACILETMLWFLVGWYLKYLTYHFADEDVAYITLMVPRDWVD